MSYTDHDPATSELERAPQTLEGCCGAIPPTASGGYDCTCEGNPRCTAASDTDQETLANVLGVAYADAMDDDTVVEVEDYVAARVVAAGFSRSPQPSIKDRLDMLRALKDIGAEVVEASS